MTIKLYSVIGSGFVLAIRHYYRSIAGWVAFFGSPTFSSNDLVLVKTNRSPRYLATGYDAIDLTDGMINGGKQSTVKFGVNRYPISHVRVMANYAHVLDITITGISGRPGAFDNADLDIVETHVQLDY